MKIEHIHIINFGTFHNFEQPFNEHLNLFQKENGWGKTTLSVFIKAMFYGLDDKKTKSLSEREKYMPWQGGKYGGSLSFSHNNRQYRIYRTFGNSKKEDEFELTDLKTNEKSNDYSQNIGTELFGINSETYSRSVYVTLDETPSESSDISARLNGLIENADISDFNRAVKILDDEAKNIRSRKTDAKLVCIQKKLDSIKKELEEIEYLIGENEKKRKEAEDIARQIEQLEEEKKNLNEKISQYDLYQKKERYEYLKGNVEKKKAEREKTEKFFKEGVPDKEKLENIYRLSDKLKVLEQNLASEFFSESEKDDYETLKKYFAGTVPESEEIRECTQQYDEYQNFIKQENKYCLTEEEVSDFEKLNSLFSNTNVSEQVIKEKIDQWEKIQQQKILSGELDITDETVRAGETGKNFSGKTIAGKNVAGKNIATKRNIFFIFTLIFSAGGILCFNLKEFVHNTAVGLFFLFAGSVSCAVSLFLHFFLHFRSNENGRASENGQNRQDTVLYEHLHEQILSVTEFAEKYYEKDVSDVFQALYDIKAKFDRYTLLQKKQNNYTNWLSSQKKTGTEYESSLRNFLQRYCETEDFSSLSLSSLSSLIQKLNEKVQKLKELENRKNKYSENFENKKEFERKLVAVLSEFATDKTKDYQTQVDQIRDNIILLDNCEKQLEDSIKELSDFENEIKTIKDLNYSIKALEDLKKSEFTIKELQDKLTEVDNQIQNKKIKIATLEKIINENCEKTDKKEDLENEADSLREEKKFNENEFFILSKASELLQTAKKRLDSNYSEKMNNGLRKYTKILDKKLNFSLDLKLNVFLSSADRNYEKSYLSEGYKDMVNFCLRMALADALFSDAKPALILDDPFVNYDDDKLDNALDLIKEISQNNQIVYFCCHKSREVL